jgi:hypothetical protein
MAIVNVYNYTRQRFLLEDFTSLATYLQVDLYSVFVFNPVATDISFAQVGSVKIPAGNGIPVNAQIPNRAWNLLDTNGCALNGDSVVYIATGAPVVVSHALISLGGYTPVVHIDFEGPITFPVNQLCGIRFNAGQVFTFKAS